MGRSAKYIPGKDYSVEELKKLIRAKDGLLNRKDHQDIWWREKKGITLSIFQLLQARRPSN